MESVDHRGARDGGSVVIGIGGIRGQAIKLRRCLRISVGLPVGRQLSEVVIEGSILLRHKDDVIDRIEAGVLRRGIAGASR